MFNFLTQDEMGFCSNTYRKSCDHTESLIEFVSKETMLIILYTLCHDVETV